MRIDGMLSEEQRVYSVFTLNREAKELLENSYEGIFVEAEVAEVTRARSGHMYFTLADADGKAQVSAVIWQGYARRYGERLARGQSVRCRGRLTIYEARGSYQLVVDHVEEAGAGRKVRLLSELKAKLAADGLFDASRKRELPPYPRCIGVVTSRDGAAFRDIIKVASRRFPTRILLSHAQVQGESAPEEIIRALSLLAARTDVDVVIIGRGGGSSEDLDVFNNESVVRAVAAHPHPVISAVGHEIDFTLVDFAADRRAATPSEAAEIAVPDQVAILEKFEACRAGLTRSINQRIAFLEKRIAEAESRLRAQDPRMGLRHIVERLMRCRAGLEKWRDIAIPRLKGDLALAEEALYKWPEQTLPAKRALLAELSAKLDVLSPLASLARGYAFVRRIPDKVIVRRADEAPPGTDIDVTLARGHLLCKVRGVVE